MGRQSKQTRSGPPIPHPNPAPTSFSLTYTATPARSRGAIHFELVLDAKTRVKKKRLVLRTADRGSENCQTAEAGGSSSVNTEPFLSQGRGDRAPAGERAPAPRQETTPSLRPRARSQWTAWRLKTPSLRKSTPARPKSSLTTEASMLLCSTSPSC